jgi:hypothetical protein
MATIDQFIYAKREGYSNFDLVESVERAREAAIRTEAEKAAKVRAAAIALDRFNSILAEMQKLSGGTDMKTLNYKKAEAISNLMAIPKLKRIIYEVKLRHTYGAVMTKIAQNISAEQTLAADIVVAAPLHPTRDWSAKQLGTDKRGDNVSLRPPSFRPKTDTGQGRGQVLYSGQGRGQEEIKNDVILDEEQEESFFEKNKMAIIGVGAVALVGAGIFFMRKK